MQGIFLSFLVLVLTGPQFTISGIDVYFGQRPINYGENTVHTILTDSVLTCRNLLQAYFSKANAFLKRATTEDPLPFKCFYLNTTSDHITFADTTFDTHILNDSVPDSSNDCTHYGCAGNAQCSFDMDAYTSVCKANPQNYYFDIVFEGSAVGSTKLDFYNCRGRCKLNTNCSYISYQYNTSMCFMYSDVYAARYSFGDFSGSAF